MTNALNIDDVRNIRILRRVLADQMRKLDREIRAEKEVASWIVKKRGS